MRRYVRAHLGVKPLRNTRPQPQLCNSSAYRLHSRSCLNQVPWTPLRQSMGTKTTTRYCRFSLLILDCAEWHFLIIALISTLPHDTITALQDFYHERDQRQQHFNNLKAQVHQNSEIPLSMEIFSEDWNASQFWVCSNFVDRLGCRYLIS